MKLLIFAGLIATAMADTNALLKESNDQFTARMLNEVVTSNPDKSVVISAFSVLPPLAQLSLASLGATHDQILKVIGLPNDNVTKEVFSSVNDQLKAVKGVDLKMANRIYIAKESEINPNFAELSRNIFNSDVKSVDFTQSTITANEINSWVEDQTNKKIKDLIDPNSLDQFTRAILVNAIYFKGTWKDKFNEFATKEGDFHVTKELTVKVPYMAKTNNYRYAESAELDAKLLELPYEGDEASFLVVLPNKVDGLKALEEKLKDPSALSKATSEMFSTEVALKLPKFKIETTTDLKDILQKMDVKDLFSADKAKLDNLLVKATNLYVSGAIQKAFIEINEEGAEAAAANEFTGLMAAPRPLKKLEFQADRPFYFQIQHNGLTMFEGIFRKS